MFSEYNCTHYLFVLAAHKQKFKGFRSADFAGHAAGPLPMYPLTYCSLGNSPTARANCVGALSCINLGFTRRCNGRLLNKSGKEFRNNLHNCLHSLKQVIQMDQPIRYQLFHTGIQVLLVPS